MEEANPSDDKRVSANDMDYARFVLYVRKGVGPCEHLVRLASRCLDVIVQDVDKIQGARPQWLRGVPTLVELPSFKLATGTDAVHRLEAHTKTGVQAMPAGMLGVGSVGAPLDGDDLSLGNFGLAVQDARYEDTPSEKQAGGGATLESMMRLRAARSAEQT